VAITVHLPTAISPLQVLTMDNCVSLVRPLEQGKADTYHGGFLQAPLSGISTLQMS